MTSYRVWDTGIDAIQGVWYEAESAQEAADAHVEGGDWGEIESTTWITVYVAEALPEDEWGDPERIKIAVDPKEPDCVSDEGHDWRRPVEAVGGIKENPGVRGNGGGVVVTSCCVRCGCGRVEDSWAQDPMDGEQGLDSVSYEPDQFADYLAALDSRRCRFDADPGLARVLDETGVEHWVEESRYHGRRLVVAVEDVVAEPGGDDICCVCAVSRSPEAEWGEPVVAVLGCGGAEPAGWSALCRDCLDADTSDNGDAIRAYATEEGWL